MGNIHVFYHRIPALSTSIISSIALGFTLASGLRCDFILVAARPGEFLEYATEDGLLVELYESSIGIACNTQPAFSRDGDFLWNLSFVFWVLACIFGLMAGILSWLLTTIVGPTEQSWKLLSILSAISTVVQVPIFLMFEVEPCINHLCFVSTSSIMLIISCIFWVTSTIITQCQDPPLWKEELNAWRVQKEREAGQSLPRSQDSKMVRWLKRRKWANDGIAKADTLHLKATESESANGGEDCLALIENGSYYADSNNSRLMLKVMPNGKRPGDDRKSETSFGDIEDMVDIVDVEKDCFPEDEENGNVVPRKSPPKNEKMIIRSHEDPAPSHTEIESGSPTRGSKTRGSPRKVSPARGSPTKCALNNQVQTVLQSDSERDSPGRSKSDKPVVITGLRALAGRVIRESRLKKNFYCFLDDETSDADDEHDEEERARCYSPPMTPSDIEKLDQKETASPFSLDGSPDPLLRDWNALHATTGGEVPNNITLSDNSMEDEPEPVLYTSDDSRSAVSLTSFIKTFEENQDDLSGLSSSTLSDSSADDDHSRQSPKNRSRRRDRRKRRRKRQYPGSISVASRTSLLELTIAEETDIDLRESSDEENPSEEYPLRTVKSASDVFDLVSKTSAQKLTRVKTFPPLSNVSEETARRITVDELLKERGQQPMKAVSEAGEAQGKVYCQSLSRVVSQTEDGIIQSKDRRSSHSFQSEAEKCVGSGSETEESTTSSDSDCPGDFRQEPKPVKLRRTRSLGSFRCNKRKSFHPVSPLSRRRKSTTPKFSNDETNTEGGIFSSSVHVVSDESSDNSSSTENRSIRSTVSRQARRARIKRLRSEHQRSNTLGPPKNRLPRQQRKQNIILDPTVRAIMLKRTEGEEYGADEASL